MIFSISKHIYSVLSTDAGVTSLVSTRIYPLGTKNNVTFPFIVYERTSVTPEYNKEAMEYAEVEVSIYAVADTYAASENIAEKIGAALNKKTATYTGFKVIDAWITGATENYVDDAFVQTINFKFQIIETNGN